MEKNYAQEEVIHTIEGQLIVIACPGSGKRQHWLEEFIIWLKNAKFLLNIF